ncbi:MAG: hypothetical protein WDN49_01265 [Acetobacteraceae bacterium]
MTPITFPNGWPCPVSRRRGGSSASMDGRAIWRSTTWNRSKPSIPPAYHRVSGAHFTPWTRRVLSRVRVFRATGTQHYPGDALTGEPTRLILLRFRNVEAGDEPDLLAGLRANYRRGPDTMQIRLLTGAAESAGDCFGIVEMRTPAPEQPLAIESFGRCATKLDMVNTYARY